MNKKDIILNAFNVSYEITDKGKIKSKGKNRFWSVTDVSLNLVKTLVVVGIDVSEKEISDVINEELKTKVVIDDTQDVNVEEFVKAFLMENRNKHWKWNNAMTELEYSFEKNGVTAPTDFDALLNSLKTENIKTGSMFKSEDLKTILTDIQFKAQHNALEQTVKNISYDVKYETYCNDFLKGIYDYLKPTESFEIFSTLMKHWAWQVKRKFNNKSVIYHIWLNFMGGTSLGKSTMIDKICAPMADFKSRTTIAKLFDDTKEIKRLTEKYILNFDELAVNNPDGGDGGLTADQLAMLKSIITGDKIDTRVYGTQNQSTKRITFSCISSANYHLYDIIFDEASMRRFFEFHCMAEKPQSYDEINKWIDEPLGFWKGINENLEDGYWDVNSKLGKEIDSIQRGYYPTKSTLMYWLEYNTLTKGDDKPTSIFPQYREWCKENGYKAKTLIAFINELKKRFPQFIDNTGVLSLKVMPKDSKSTENTDSFFSNLGLKNKEINVNEDFE